MISTWFENIGVRERANVRTSSSSSMEAAIEARW